jgi:hypothetical protein
LIFDTEKDGFTSEKFHEKCDKFKNNLVVIENDQGMRFGGFTSLGFACSEEREGKFVTDGVNFLFSLTKMKIYS